jgi:hypothetical protein
MVRAELLDLRRDIGDVLADLFVAFSRSPEEARRLMAHAGLGESFEFETVAQAEKLRVQLLDLRRDVAIAMANLFIAAGRSQEEAKRLVMDGLRPKSGVGSKKVPRDNP